MSARDSHRELVIFDCDGVLVDSEPISVRVDALVLDEVGLDLSEQEIVDRFVGRSPAVMRQAIEAHLGHPLSKDWIERTRPRYRQAFERELRPIDGVEEALDRIPAATCVASSSEPEELAFKLELTGLHERFAGRIFSAAAVQNGKPAPDLFLYAAHQMGVSPDACAVVE
ncbi:MAG: HAD family hydrolase, partial [Solirubrobacteraceae bacterium]